MTSFSSAISSWRYASSVSSPGTILLTTKLLLINFDERCISIRLTDVQMSRGHQLPLSHLPRSDRSSHDPIRHHQCRYRFIVFHPWAIRYPASNTNHTFRQHPEARWWRDVWQCSQKPLGALVSG